MQIFSNLAVSVDGKISSVKRGLQPLGSKADRLEMQRLRKRADAVLVGGATFRSFPKGVKNKVNVLVSRSLKGISLNQEKAFLDPKTQWVVFCAPSHAKAWKPHLPSHIEIFPWAGANGAVKKLKGLGVRKLLIEGGGEIMWEFVREKLIQKFHVTVTPRLLGGKTAPTLVDGAGFPPGKDQRLTLKSLRRVANELFLIYQRK